MARNPGQLGALISAGTDTIERPPPRAPAPIAQPDLEAGHLGEDPEVKSPITADDNAAAAPADPPAAQQALENLAAAASPARRPSRPMTWKTLVASPKEAATHSTRRQSPTRTVDGRISRPVAAAFAAHCNEELDNTPQADLIEVILRAYLDAVGKAIRD